MSVGDIGERKEQPAYVMFERVPVEDKAAALAAGRGTVQYRDVDYVLVTPPYSKDTFRQRADKWFAQMRVEANNGRLPRQWLERYEKTYDLWKRGEAMPLDGTAINGWSVITPAQQKTLVVMNILTVEALAAVNDEGMRRIGMGAMELKNKAVAWLSQAKDKGPLTLENAKLKNDVAALTERNKQLEDQVRDLVQQVSVLARGGLTQQHFEQSREPEGIEASDIIEDLPQPAPQPAPHVAPQVVPIPKRRGRPPKVRPLEMPAPQASQQDTSFEEPI